MHFTWEENQTSQQILGRKPGWLMQGCWRLPQDTLSAAQMQLHAYETLKYLMITEM